MTLPELPEFGHELRPNTLYKTKSNPVFVDGNRSAIYLFHLVKIDRGDLFDLLVNPDYA